MLPQPRLVADARSFVRRCCVGAHAGSDMCDAAVLLASELVTNAIVHGSGEIRIDVRAGSDGVWVEVSDRGVKLPVLRAVKPDSIHGRGMVIVDAACSRWGIDDHHDRKTVWFQLGVI